MKVSVEYFDKKKCKAVYRKEGKSVDDDMVRKKNSSNALAESFLIAALCRRP
jgi:hypothetical protein